MVESRSVIAAAQIFCKRCINKYITSQTIHEMEKNNGRNIDFNELSFNNVTIKYLILFQPSLTNLSWKKFKIRNSKISCKHLILQGWQGFFYFSLPCLIWKNSSQ